MPYKAEDVYHPMEKRPDPDRPSWEGLTGILINLEYSFPLNPIAVYDSHRMTDTASQSCLNLLFITSKHH